MERTKIYIDEESNKLLGLLAKHENRKKIQELRFLLHKRAEHLKIRVPREKGIIIMKKNQEGKRGRIGD